MVLENQAWTDHFFSDCQPSVDLTNSSFDPDTFQQFQYEKQHWRLGRLLDQRDFSTLPEEPPALVLQLYAKSRDGILRFAAKTFLEYSDEKARIQLCRLPSSHHSIDAVKRDLDPFLAEARAFEQIAKYPPRWELRPRAIVLESISPDLVSRRILSAESHVPDDMLENFPQKLEKLSLSPFERKWYISLFADRFRRLRALHDIGISHGDVLDRHFRLPGDFYDTVLYDFSIAYTFSPSWPYRMNFRSPGSLSRIRKRDREHVEHFILERAEKMDFRFYLSNTLQMNSDTIKAICSMPSGEALNLELIILKVMHQPDDFNAPSLASVFPFLEAIRPEGHLTWHIVRAQDPDHYVAAWVAHVGESGVSEKMTLISFAGEKCCSKDMFPAGLAFYLILIPQTWNREEITGKLLEACARLDSLHKPGIVITKDEFDYSGHGSGEDEAKHAQQPANASATIPTAPSQFLSTVKINFISIHLCQ